MGVRVGGLALEYEVESIENIDGLDNVGLGTGLAVVSGMDTAGKIKGMGGHEVYWVERYGWVGR